MDAQQPASSAGMTFLREPYTSANVEIGRSTYFMNDLQLKTWVPGERIIIGRFCSISSRVFICAGGNHATDIVSTYPFDYFFLNRPKPHRTYRTTRDTVIGNDVWIGAGATILGGAQVGHGAVVANSAVVFGDVPPYATVAGNPAKVVRYRFSRGLIERLLRIAWWDWPEPTIRQHVEWFYRPIQEFADHFDPQPEASNHGRIDQHHPTGTTHLAADPARHPVD